MCFIYFSSKGHCHTLLYLVEPRENQTFKQSLESSWPQASALQANADKLSTGVQMGAGDSAQRIH